MSRITITLLGLLVSIASASLQPVRANQEMINIDYGAHLNPAFTTNVGPAAVGAPGDLWNLYSRDNPDGTWRDGGTLANLVWNSGETSSVQLSVSNAAGAWYTSDSDPMLQSYLYPLSRSGDIVSVVSELPPGDYDVYVYAHGLPAAENAQIEVRNGRQVYGIRATSSASNWDPPGWTEGSEYVLFRYVNIAAGEPLTIVSHGGSSGLAVINGVQIVKSQLHPGPLNLLNIDFGSHLNPALPPKNGTAAVGNSALDYWNLYSRDGANGAWLDENYLENLRWSDGRTSEMFLDVTNAAGAWYTLDKDPMFESYLYPISRSGYIAAVLVNMTPGFYDVYIYAHGQPAQENAVVLLYANGAFTKPKSTSSAPDWDKPTWTENSQYVVFHNVGVGTDGALGIVSAPGDSGLAVINGAQLVFVSSDVPPPPPLQDPTLADWTFEDGVSGAPATVANDSSGNGHAVHSIGAKAPQFVASQPPADGSVSVRFPAVTGGIGAALRADDSLDFNPGSEFTIEASVNPGPSNTDFNRGIVVGQDAVSGRLAYGLDYRSETRKVDFLIADAGGRVDSVAAVMPNDGQSHHVAGLYKNQMLSIYLDKVLVASANSTLVLGINPGSPGRLTIGANDIGGFWFDGTVDRVRLSAKALTPDQFFAMGTVAPGNPLRITTPLADQTVSAGSTVTLKVVADGPAPLTYSWSLNGAPIPGATSDTLSLNNVQPSQSGNYAVTVTSGSCIAPQGAAAWWSAEGDAVDRVGGNNGTLQNGAGFDTGEVGSGFKLDGVDDQVVVPDSPSLAIGAGQDFSIEGWIKTSGGGPNDIAIIFEKRTNPDAFTAVGISLYLLGGRLGAQLADQPLAANHFSSYWSSGPDLRDGQFHHVAMSVTRNAANGGKL